MKVKVGDVIKSWDFEPVPGVPERDCYMIGRVYSVDLETIECATIEVVWGGEKDLNIPATFKTLKQGLMRADSRYDRVSVIN